MRDELQRLAERAGGLEAADERELEAMLDRCAARVLADDLRRELGAVELPAEPWPPPAVPEPADPAQLAFWESLAPEPEPLTLF